MEIIIGAAVSLLVQAVKSRFGGGMWTIAIAVVASVAAAGLYSLLVATGYWQTVAMILGTAGAFYAYVIQRFESAPQQDSTADLMAS